MGGQIRVYARVQRGAVQAVPCRAVPCRVGCLPPRDARPPATGDSLRRPGRVVNPDGKLLIPLGFSLRRGRNRPVGRKPEGQLRNAGLWGYGVMGL